MLNLVDAIMLSICIAKCSEHRMSSISLTANEIDSMFGILVILIWVSEKHLLGLKIIKIEFNLLITTRPDAFIYDTHANFGAVVKFHQYGYRFNGRFDKYKWSTS